MKHYRKGQIEITFNWVYILIAGAVILLFFVSLIVKQKEISEERLAEDVVRVMESIFTGAQVSEKTKSSLPLGGLSERDLYFRCEDAVGEYGIKGLPARTQNSLDPLFAPKEVTGTRLILWSLPYFLPFKITDFLFLTSDKHHYVFVGAGSGFSDQFVEGALDSDPKLSISVQKVNLLSEVVIKSKETKVRVIDADGTLIKDGQVIPENLLIVDDDKLTAASFTANKEINFFKKRGAVWRKINPQPITIVSRTAIRDAAKYAAVFADDPEIYRCNMEKAYRRLMLIAEVYEGKVGELETYYENPTESGSCIGFVNGFTLAEGNIRDTLTLYQTRAKACSLLADNSCADIVNLAERLRLLNEKLAEECSVTLY